MNRIKRYEILCRLKNHHDSLDTINLIYKTDFELLIALLLSAQSKDIQVNKISERLFQIANTPYAMLLLGLDRLKFYIRSIGLFNIKANNIISTCHLLIERHNGTIPGSRVKLESLPGVGRKTANIILNLIFKRSTIAVDTHVFRFCNRSRFAIGNNAFSVEKKLLSVVPAEFKRNCHQWLVTYGRNMCRAQKPKCSSCVINDLCEFKNKNYTL